MPLTSADLKAIRTIIREELERCEQGTAERASAVTSPTSDRAVAHVSAIRARLAFKDGKCSLDEMLRAEATSRMHAESWISGAKRMRRDEQNESAVTFAEMLAFARARHERNARVDAKRKATRARNRAARKLDAK